MTDQSLIAVGIAIIVLTGALLAVRRRMRRPRRLAPQRGRARRSSSATAPQARLRVSRTFGLDLEARLTPAPNSVAPPFDALELPDSVRVPLETVAGRLRERRGVIDALSGETRDPAELAGLIQTDRGLTHWILERTNGPEYGLDRPLEQVSRAVLLLGHAEVRFLAWRACLSEVIRPSSSMTAGAFEQHWQHAFTVGRAAHALATNFGLPRPDMVATAAFLHDCGKLLALAAWPDRARFYDSVHFTRREGLSAEADRLGVEHAGLGASLCGAARLPEEIVRLVRQHHAPSYLSPTGVAGDQRALAIVHLADLLAHASRAHLQAQPVETLYQPHDGWLALLKLRKLEEALAPNLVLSLLDPATAWRGSVLLKGAA